MNVLVAMFVKLLSMDMMLFCVDVDRLVALGVPMFVTLQYL